MSETACVIDFHSHILPEMDDGSKSIEMSVKMLCEAHKMGVDIMIATPHFYGHRESVQSFLSRRKLAWQRLSQAIEQQDLPAVLLGAEVAFFSGLTALEDIDSLCINGTRTLLLEMPFSSWAAYELEAVSTLCLDRGYQIVLAHFERFFSLQKDQRLLDSLLELPLWIQINAGVLLSFTRRRRWVEMFRERQAHLLGSDCHDLTNRPPNLGAGRKILHRKAGPEVLERMDALGMRLLGLNGGQNESG